MQWHNLVHLDALRARSKPVQPPKKPEAAPFFLPTVAGADCTVLKPQTASRLQSAPVKHLSCSTLATQCLPSSGLEGRPIFAPEAAAEGGAERDGSRVLAKSTSVAMQGSAFTRTLQVQHPHVC